MGYINGSLGEVISFEEDDEYGVLPKVKLIDGTTLVVEPENLVGRAMQAGKTIAQFPADSIASGLGDYHS